MAFRDTLFVRSWSFWKVPLLFATRPSVVELDDDHCVVKLPFRHKNRNHLGSMYFGALCIGADCAGGLMAMRLIQAGGGGVSLIFKDFKANFLKRPEGDVHFTCRDGKGIADLVKRTRESGERESMPVHVTATVPSKLGDEPVAEFELTLSLKKKE